jgi:hypothetical protein
MRHSDTQTLEERLVALFPRVVFDDEPMWGIAVDIGTTTVTVWLVDLMTGEVSAQVSEYNGQISRGEDVISRIIYSSKPGGLEELQKRVIDTINNLVTIACKRATLSRRRLSKPRFPQQHDDPPALDTISKYPLSPFITTINHAPILTARSLAERPSKQRDCLPGWQAMLV